jgi:signal transduction histidine kinase/CHASE2 domain-containing sensor protein
MKRFAAVLAVSAFAAALVLLLSFTVFFDGLNAFAYDFTMRMAGPVSPEAPLTLAVVDEESLDRVGRWPWSRKQFAAFVEGVANAGPAVLVLDVMLDDPESEDGDAALAAALGRVPRVVLPARIVTGDNGERWQRPQSRFLQSNASLGHVHTEPELVDSISRRVYSAKTAEGSLVPSLSIAALEAFGADLDPSFQIRQDSGFSRVERSEVKIRFAGDTGVTFTQVPAWKVLQGDVDPAQLKDRIVLIGVTAEGLQEEDRWFTPFAIEGLKTPGVEIHANAIDTLYARRWIEDVPLDVQYFCLMGLVFLLVVMDNRFEGGRFYAAAVLLIPALVALSWFLMKQWNVWLPFPSLLTAVILTVPGLEVWKVVRVNRDLDSKIAKLSLWGDNRTGSSQNNAMDRVLALPPSKEKDAWIESIRATEAAAAHRARERIRMWASPLKTSRWRLQAVDFLNEELVRYLEFNRTVLGSIDDVTIVCDVRGTVLYQNPAASRLIGFQESPGFAPQYFSQLLDGRDFVQACAEVVGGQRTVALPFVPGKGGGIFNIALSPVPGTGLVLTLHDATAQHELNLAKNEMVSLVSHELRTPLTAIRGYSDMLLKYDLVQDKGRKFLGTIVEESDRLGRLIQSFLDIAYIESGRQQVSKTEFDVAPMFDDLRSVLDPVAAAKSIQLVANGSGVSRVLADRMLLYQALTNLVTNAIKYSPSGTTVGVAASNGSRSVSFEVRDEGFGIPQEEADRIFDKFYRLANKETREQTGFGLGLAFVKEVALRHGGDVTVKSEVGKGSVFTLRIPV